MKPNRRRGVSLSRFIRTLALPAAPILSPRVVVICGSTRFMGEMTQAAREETIAGRIVVRPECDLKASDPLWPPSRIEWIKGELDELHRAKVRLADEVLVVAPGGYVGSSTRAEIGYALGIGKPVRYWPFPAVIDDELAEINRGEGQH